MTIKRWMTMREKMAVAICESQDYCSPDNTCQCPSFMDQVCADKLQMADAALDELLEPSPTMMDAAMRPYASDRPLHPSHGIKSAGQLPAYDLIETAWKAMIVAAKDIK